MGNFFNDNMEKLGGNRIYKFGVANAEGNHTEDDFNEWKKGFWRGIFRYYESL